MPESAIDIGERQGWRRRGAAHGGMQSRIAQSKLALADVAAEIGNRDLDLLGLQSAQALGDQADLREPARGRRDRGRGAHHLGEKRHTTVSTGSPCRSDSTACSLSRSWRRSTIMSIAPFSSRNSARWKPSGSFCRTVCSMTRGPAKPMSALGSAMTTSPIMAKLAETRSEEHTSEL